MTIQPSTDTFQILAKQFDVVPVWRRMLSDNLTPVTAFRLLEEGSPSACLFESVIGGEKVGRYSFIAAHPRERLAAWGSNVTIERQGQSIKLECDDPLDELRSRLKNQRVAPTNGLPPFIGGAIGYAAYDVMRYTENLPNAPQDDRGLPDLDFSFYDEIVIFDNVSKTMFIVDLCRPGDYTSPAQAYEASQQRLEKLANQLSKPIPNVAAADIELTKTPNLPAKSNFTQEQFESAVQRCTEYIKAGDIFQVVISQRFEVDLEIDPLEVYRSLRVVNPSPFMFLLRTPATTLVGSSPEVMCRVMERVVTVRPLAGTRRRGASEEEDLLLESELLADPKERAEHVMLVDLGRNDVGRVAQFGSVKLTDVMAVERYSHVMHISSNVDGILRNDMDAMDALKACLPAGTVSGAPKIRAMEVIDEVEPQRRGPYAGAVGYFDYRGNMDTCIALRTMVFANGKVFIQAGAGIVADSDPTSEYQETVNKARAMLKAVEVTVERVRSK